jgi:hypothetical protein
MTGSYKKINKRIKYLYAQMCNEIYWLRYNANKRLLSKGWLLTIILAVIYIFISSSLLGRWHYPLEQYYADPGLGETRLSSLRTLLVTIGGAFIGAAAIAFSLIMFAMQINVERMPHGLFKKFSTDMRLLAAFGSTFILAILVTTTALIPSAKYVEEVLLITFWSLLFIFFTLLYAYRRALVLISPLEQLRILRHDTKKQIQIWGARAARAAPLFEFPEDMEKNASKYDSARLAYFSVNKHWTLEAEKALEHAVSFSRRYAEKGDYEVAGMALEGILAINQSYVKIKGKTFFSNEMFFDNPLVTDSFINKTLEHLRQNIRIAIARADEQQIEQTLKALAALTNIYLKIDYSREGASKTHAYLASGYLSDAVLSILPHNMPDVLMEGTRLLGSLTTAFLTFGKSADTVPLVDKIGLLAYTGAMNEKYRPVTLTAMEQLSNLVYNLLLIKKQDIRFAAKKINSQISDIARQFLVVPDTFSTHSTYLAPYYSSTNQQSFLLRVTDLINKIAKAEEGNLNAEELTNITTIINNIKSWSDDIYQHGKEVLLEAINKESPFVFDIVSWIKYITSALLALSNMKSCTQHTKDELRKNALWLISTLSFIPDDKNKITTIENYQITETLFQAAINARNMECFDIAEKIYQLLLDWAFKAGKYTTGWAILENAFYALSTLAVLNSSGDALKKEVQYCITNGKLPDQELRDRTAREIRREAVTIRNRDFTSSSIERGMGTVDQNKLKELLKELADIISPGTKDEKVRPDFF